MDRQDYLRRLRARIEHVDGALDRAHQVDPHEIGRRQIEALREQLEKVEAAGDDWQEHREDVESTWRELHEQVEGHHTTFGEVAESVRDGAVDIFRGEPSDIVKRAEEIIRKANVDRD